MRWVRGQCLTGVPVEYEDGDVVGGGGISYQRAHHGCARILRCRHVRAAGTGVGDLLVESRGERVDAPVVSFSIGAACVFRFGNIDNRKAPYTDVELRSGDLFVFGGPSRFAYHGVVRQIQAGTDDPGLGLDGGRINYTIRVTGL